MFLSTDFSWISKKQMLISWCRSAAAGTIEKRKKTWLFSVTIRIEIIIYQLINSIGFILIVIHIIWTIWWQKKSKYCETPRFNRICTEILKVRGKYITTGNTKNNTQLLLSIYNSHFVDGIVTT